MNQTKLVKPNWFETHICSSWLNCRKIPTSGIWYVYIFVKPRSCILQMFGMSPTASLYSYLRQKGGSAPSKKLWGLQVSHCCPIVISRFECMRTMRLNSVFNFKHALFALLLCIKMYLLPTVIVCSSIVEVPYHLEVRSLKSFVIQNDGDHMRILARRPCCLSHSL